MSGHRPHRAAPRVGDRVVGAHGRDQRLDYGIVSAVHTLRGEPVVHVIWDAPHPDDPSAGPWHDTVRAADTVIVNRAGEK